MSTPNLTNSPESIISAKDSIVIRENRESIRGGRSLDTTGYIPETIKSGHVIIKETSSGTYKPMPTVEAAEASVATFGSVTGGSAYTNGTYVDAPLSGGTGKGARATIVIASNAVTTVTKTAAGSGYTVGDVLTVPASLIGGTGAGFSVPVATVADVAAAYASLPDGHEYAGVLIATVLTKRPFAGILVDGTVNPAATPYPMTSILSAFKTAQPDIAWRQD